jgi:GTP-dependent phosphoenolpyruvate carboxykinase
MECPGCGETGVRTLFRANDRLYHTTEKSFLVVECKTCRLIRLETGPRLTNPPLIFHVNWFRKDAAGKFLWPGFGDNMRVLKWIVDRCEGRGGAGENPIGSVPRAEDLDLDGLEGVSLEKMRELLFHDPKSAMAGTIKRMRPRVS